MKQAFVSKLKNLLDAISEQMELYVPKKNDRHSVFAKYDSSKIENPEYINIRTCTPVKEFLFPMREIAAVFPDDFQPLNIKPFAVFGLKACDLRAIDILDRVFQDEDFLDPFYTARREKMFIISSDCYDPAESCFCTLFDGKVFPEKGFDLNVSKIKDGFIIEVGSEKGEKILLKHQDTFAEVPKAALEERRNVRVSTQQDLEEQTSGYEIDTSIDDIIRNSSDSNVFDELAEGCIECQACTRVCPTCHCFYLHDTPQKEYFSKSKMWDSCMRLDYAKVAGGENPRQILGDRLKHRLMHKFVYFLERYGIQMCVGCGRCVDADAGGMDLREVLSRLNRELKEKKETKLNK